jgi:catechol 2,3-dioxygenase-like lactoylglutathione lyase family enzyme
VATTLLVNVDVPELAAGERFYADAFGLRRGRRFGDGAVELLGWPLPLYLLVKPAGSAIAPSAPTARRSYDRHWTPVHLDVVVDDVDAALARALAAGAVQEAPIHDAAYGRLALLADPFGNGLCLLQFSARGYDAIATV